MSRNAYVNFITAEEAAKLIPDNAVIAAATSVTEDGRTNWLMQ